MISKQQDLDTNSVYLYIHLNKISFSFLSKCAWHVTILDRSISWEDRLE